MVRPMKRVRSLAEYWLWLGVTAIAVAGLYAFVPVIGRTPQFKDLPVAQRFFDVALVIHVDLSVMIWFFSMICMGGALMMQEHQSRWPYWGKAGFWCCAIATLLIAFAPLDAWVPVKSDYIPMLHNGMFMAALGLLFAGLVVSLLPVLVVNLQPKHYRVLSAVDLAYLAAALTVLFGLVAYAISSQRMMPAMALKDHYEHLYWVGGHIMQFAFTLLVMAAWLTLLMALGALPPKRKWAEWIYNLTLLGPLVSMAGFFKTQWGEGEFDYHQTRVMIEWGGVGATLMAVHVVWQLLRTRITRERRAYASALIVSIILFYFGGALGLMIHGQNVTVPAHYHGMIVGITQALMGLAYVMLPRFGYRSVAGARLAFWQPIVYGIGQLMHIGGLAYCGGYGILRKTSGGFANLAPDIKVALGIFGMGGLIAISGGILFVIVMVCAKRDISASLQGEMVQR